MKMMYPGHSVPLQLWQLSKERRSLWKEADREVATLRPEGYPKLRQDRHLDGDIFCVACCRCMYCCFLPVQEIQRYRKAQPPDESDLCQRLPK